MDKYKELLQLVTSLEGDFIKFYDQGNKAAGTRLRAGMKQVGDFAKATRSQVQEIKNAQA